MKKMIRFISFLSLALANHSQAQFTQVELFSGFDKTDFTAFSRYPIDKSNTFSLTTLAFFQKFRNGEDRQFDEIGVQPTLFWNVHKNIAIGTSLYYNSFAGFSERLSASFTIKHPRLLVMVIPTVAHSEQKEASYAEAFVQFQYNTPVSENTLLWLSGQFLTIWDGFKTHSRSYEQVRAGISLHGHQLGVGVDFDQYGPAPITKSSLGMYYRKTL